MIKYYNSVKVSIDKEALNEKNIVYRLIFPNKMSYIGKTKQQLRNRLSAHCGRAFENSSESNKKLSSAIKEFMEFSVEILYIGNDLSVKEQEQIKKYETLNSGYNSVSGGDSHFLFCEETKEKISKTTTGKLKNRNGILQYDLNMNLIKE